MFGALMIIGLGLGMVIALLGHPKIGAMVLGGRCRSADHKLNEGL